jgi:hypothetical protein
MAHHNDARATNLADFRGAFQEGVSTLANVMRNSFEFKAVTQPPIFNRTNITHNLRRYEDYAYTRRWCDQDKKENYIRCVDPGVASEIHELENSAATWKDFKAALLDRYGRDDFPVSSEELQRILLKDHETYDGYISLFEETAARAPMVNEDVMTGIFLSQFPENTQSQIVHACGQKVTWKKAKQVARDKVSGNNRIIFLKSPDGPSPLTMAGPCLKPVPIPIGRDIRNQLGDQSMPLTVPPMAVPAVNPNRPILPRSDHSSRRPHRGRKGKGKQSHTATVDLKDTPTVTPHVPPTTSAGTSNLSAMICQYCLGQGHMYKRCRLAHFDIKNGRCKWGRGRHIICNGQTIEKKTSGGMRAKVAILCNLDLAGLEQWDQVPAI